MARQNCDKNMGLLAWHHILFEVMFMMNFITVTVFWSSLYNQAVSDCSDHWSVPLCIVNVWYAHLMPGLSAVLSFMTTDVTVRGSHVKMIIPIAIAYGIINYIETKKKGKALYWFLTWEDHWSFIIYGGLIIVFTTFWFVLSAFTI